MRKVTADWTDHWVKSLSTNLNDWLRQSTTAAIEKPDRNSEMSREKERYRKRKVSKPKISAKNSVESFRYM